MRITTTMTSNKMMLNINKSMRSVDRYYSQLTTGKKIQMASDSPIIAARALRFRNNIAETEQYQRNASQATSWMEITEQGFSNLERIISSIRSLCIEGASDQFEISDREKMVTEIQALFEQAASEMNVTYAGRYVFSGYRTDIPPVIDKDNSNVQYNITQLLSVKDVENANAYVKTNSDTAPTVYNVNRLKLPYNNLTNLNELVTLDRNGNTSGTYAVTTVTMPDPAAYTVGDNEIKFISETGELILGNNIVEAFKQENAQGGISVNYDKTGVKKGELNPVVYYETQTIISSTTTLAGISDNSVTYIGKDSATAGSLSQYAHTYTDGAGNWQTVQVSKADLIVDPQPEGDFTLDLKDAGGNVIRTLNVKSIDGLTLDEIYNPGPDDVYYKPPTSPFVNGEIIFGSDAYALAQSAAELTVDYDVEKTITTSGTYLNISPVPNGDFTLNLTNAAGSVTDTLNVKVMPLSANADAAYNPGANDVHYIPETGELIFGSAAKTLASGAAGITAVYKQNGTYYSMENQALEFELGINTRVQINNLSKDVLTPSLYSDIKTLVEMVKSVVPSTEAELLTKYSSAAGGSLTGEALTEAVTRQQNDEVQKFRSVIQTAFSNLIGELDKHVSTISTEYTNLGSRMNRVDFITSRLDEDNVSYNKLMADNEDIDYFDVIMRLRSAESVYQAALSAGSKVIQTTLADFIR